MRARILGALALALATGPACRRVPEKTRVLEAMVREVVVPLDTALASESDRFVADADRLASADGDRAAALEAARGSWRRAAVAWRRAFAFRDGPVVDTNALSRAAFWPPNPARVQALLREDTPIDADQIEALGADAKGLFVIEALLFSNDWAGATGARRARCVQALTRDVARYAKRVSARLPDAGAGAGAAFATTYAAAGQPQVNRLVNQMVETVEGVSTNRLNLVLGLADSRLLRASEVEGWPSGTSNQLALALLTATQALYVGGGGGGLGDLVRAASPEQDRRVRAAFAAAVSAVQSLGAPLEQVVSQRRPALEAAAKATKDLELAIKVDMTNALGVTLTFTAGDGD